MKKLFYHLQIALVACAALFTLSSCDDSKDETPIDLTTEEKEFLNGDVVLYTKAEMGGVNKTLLPTGCPAIFNFDWQNKVDANNTAANIVKIKMVNFQVGSMPMTATFECDAQIIRTNQWDKDEYKGQGWVKFQGLNNGHISMDGGNTWLPSETKGNITGYYNTESHKINCIIDFNYLSIKANILLQTIDKSLLAKYDELKKQYEIDLEKYKEEHGIADPVPSPKSFLDGTIVTYCKVNMNGEDKTVLPTGCPTKFTFDWNKRVNAEETSENVVRIKMEKFKVGAMPMFVAFDCDVESKELALNERPEGHERAGWHKFTSKDNGVVHMIPASGGNETPMPTKGTINGYYNSKTHEIELNIDFKLKDMLGMDIKAEIFRQELDKSKLAQYDELLKKYEEDLAKWEAEHK